MVAVLAVAASTAAVRAVGDRFYSRADSIVGGLMAVKPAKRSTAGVAAVVVVVEALEGGRG
jgi:hypothetical protein